MTLPIVICCPECGRQHVDEGEWVTRLHRTHLCSDPACGTKFRPALVHTVGVLQLPVDTDSTLGKDTHGGNPP